jgi:mRNA interferase MazF
MSPSSEQVRRGEVWWVNLDPTIGSEIKKIRPAVVVSSDAVGKLPLKVIVPLTDWQDSFRDNIWHVPIPCTPSNGLQKNSAADAFQVKNVSLLRFHQRAGQLTQSQLEEVVSAIAIVVEAS